DPDAVALLGGAQRGDAAAEPRADDRHVVVEARHEASSFRTVLGGHLTSITVSPRASCVASGDPGVGACRAARGPRGRGSAARCPRRPRGSRGRDPRPRTSPWRAVMNEPEEPEMSPTVSMPSLETLRVTADGGVLVADIDAPPMNLLGPELVRDLVSLIQAAE